MGYKCLGMWGLNDLRSLPGSKPNSQDFLQPYSKNTYLASRKVTWWFLDLANYA